jgi:peptidoglycan/LPS O-acetylase OafA/YrhL
MMWFMLGALSMHLLLPRWQRLLDKRPKWTAACVVSVLAVLILYPFLPSLGGVRFAAVMGLVVVSLPALFVFQDQHWMDKQIGELSYPIYICHLLVSNSLGGVLDRFSANLPFVVILIKVCAVIAVAYGLNRLVAEPVENLRRRFRQPVPATKG